MAPAASSNVAATTSTWRQALEIFPKWWKLVKLLFQGPEQGRSFTYCAVVLGLAFVTTWLHVRVSYAERNFSTSMSERKVSEFYQAVWAFAGIIVFAIPFFSLANYLEGRAKLDWRALLTRRLLSQYFANKAFFSLKQEGKESLVDNPDQRICDDAAVFVSSSMNIVLVLVNKVMSCAAFAGVLWSVSPNLVLLLLFYALIGTLVTTSVFGKVLTRLHFQLLKLEGDMRFSLIRVRENAESIAFYHGERQEKKVVAARLEHVVGTTMLRLRWIALFELWSYLYDYATILVPALYTAPRYFRKEIEFGVITQAGFAFNRIKSAVSLIVSQLDALAGLAAVTDRLFLLFETLENEAKGELGGAPTTQYIKREVAKPSEGLLLEGLTFFTPGGRQLICHNLSLTLPMGSSLLIVGPSGCGKSSLLRVIAGLWGQGVGCIRAPPTTQLFFLPQKPFMPLGNLRQQLLFPAGRSSSPGSPGAVIPLNVDNGSAAQQRPGGGGGGSGKGDGTIPVSDEELAQALDRVRLPDLLTKVGGFDTEHDWSHMLSVGEQQRVAFLRVLLSCPAIAFLDEATSALDPATESHLYSTLRDTLALAGGGFVSVGHRPQLARFHSHVLQGKGGGVWEVYTSAEWQGTHGGDTQG